MRKSVGAENTFERDLWTFEDMSAELVPMVEKVWRYCEQVEIRGRTVTLKVKFQDFEQITRSRSSASAVECRVSLEKAALDLLSALFPLRKGVRLLGVTLSGLDTEEKRERRAQLALPLP